MAPQQPRVQVVSFDAEGTLATHTFSRAIWQGIVPQLYGRKHGLLFEEATERVFAQYQSVGPNRREWYDIGYWFERLGLGEPLPVIEAHRHLIEFYEETEYVLRALSGRYILVVASSTPLEFLRPLLRDVEDLFTHYFSATSTLGRLKDEEFFRWMCGELRVAPAGIVHVGDSRERDYQSPVSAGLVALHLDRSRSVNNCLHTLTDLLWHLEATEAG